MTALGYRLHNATGRSTGRLKMNDRTKIDGPFAPRLYEMLESPAYRALSLSAHRVLARVEIEHGHHAGQLNGKLPVTYQNFEDYGIHRHAIGPAIAECVALGFLKITTRGRAGNGGWRSPNVFRLTYFSPNGGKGGATATHEWRRIETVDKAQEVAREARRAAPVAVESDLSHVPDKPARSLATAP